MSKAQPLGCFDWSRVVQVATVFGRPKWDKIFTDIKKKHPGKRVGVFVCGPVVSCLRPWQMPFATALVSPRCPALPWIPRLILAAQLHEGGNPGPEFDSNPAPVPATTKPQYLLDPNLTSSLTLRL